MNQSTNAGSWDFPMLQNDEILTCMNELGIPMLATDLEKPTPGKMQLVYSAFADMLMGATKEFFDLSVEACTGEADHFDIYADSMLLMVFYQHLHKLMREVGYPQFSLQDITKPEAQRVRRILSAIINFAKFREEQLEVYDKFTAKASAYQIKHDELVEQNETMIRRVEELKVRRIKEEPLVAQARATNEALTNELYDLKRIEGATMADYDKLKVEKQELTSRLDNNAILRQNAEREIQKIRSRIVHSPEKLKQQLADMSSSLSNEKTFLNDKGKKSRELHAKIDILTTLEGDVQSCIKLMEECESELGRVDGAHKRVVHLEDLVDQKRLEVRELSVRDTQLQRQLTNAEEKLGRATRQLEAKRESTRARMAKITEERRVVQEDRMQIDIEMDKKKALVESLQSKILELREEVAGEVESVNAEFGRLSGHVDLYMKEVQHTMNQSAIIV
ncbi:Kinetochore protein nuf2 [Taphrina deformans PYCC 5710]|uniref:Kinetochore protein nuf2 n=1 Tax=Taphrina deformans (strain PYCC 5710 / ATCC 11124 / CBS 356.35 / IMI 108563 / JCM 9778 / NBRC 8474) TaxID=1097556 RepID=R4XA84_TAPDE|nr:Kinetochore protein nuf2 [Taphrina deformans PYCC 5710]|eukprot:CCG82662.1 Kinetochore protein nuf2 [Taphrina deformans PYCC 5710]